MCIYMWGGKLGMVSHACNPNALGAETAGFL